MKNIILLHVLFAACIYITPTPSCDLGALLTPVAGSPFATGGNSPTSVAYSPLINDNLFAAVANTASNNITTFQADTTTGIFTFVGTQSTDTTPISIAYSPVVSGNLFVAVANQAGDTAYIYQ